jgi:hypothetical protein
MASTSKARRGGAQGGRSLAKTSPKSNTAEGAPASTAGSDPPMPFEVSARVERQALTRPYLRPHGAPATRPLKIYTLDPSVSHRVGGVAVVHVPYEALEPGPIGSVFHIDGGGAPKSHACPPLNLQDPFLLMNAGVTPSPANGQFAMQMVYAVCTLTYAAFRRALGRDISWASEDTDGKGRLRLTVRPFGFRQRNAGFSREAGDLSFGYFRAGAKPAGFTVSKGLIFTALSHDVVAHETTHALLDGLRSSFAVPTNPDVPAFHEGFADLVALFLHFSYPGVVEQAIRDSRGAIARGSLVSDIAREFGYAGSKGGRRAALRSAIDVEGIVAFDSDIPPGEGPPLLCYDPELEPHHLGSVLVSAVFEAFVTVVRRKGDRLFRIANLDPRNVGQIQLSDEMVRALAQEAADVASRFLDICIRAIDYCPPVDMELGEYLRALITADSDLVGEDKWGYREALMRSFRRRQIFPHHVEFMTEDAVRWQPPEHTLSIPGLAFADLRFSGDPGHPADAAELRRQAQALGRYVTMPEHSKTFKLLIPGQPLPKGVTYASPPSVDSIRCARRASPDGSVLFDLVAEVTQSCTADRGGELVEFLNGCTLVIDPYGDVRYAIAKRADTADRVARQHLAMKGPLKRFWKKSGRRYVLQPDALRRLHD